MSIYDFSYNSIEGQKTPMINYKGKVLLIVNTASK
jgi:glutathione peroxidase-family protein